MRIQFVKKERAPRKEPMEFSKKILLAMFAITLIIVACAIAMSYMTQTTDVYDYLIPSIFGELSVGTGFYYWKAKRENEIKLRGTYGVSVEDPTEGDDIV
ncbi:hypothetical protein I2483_13960 [Sporosarcina sp. E16_3]|uniref:hypothetical protein n=1 Tax=Sporosarcina sp. E16_3 TaxID=2789293 RepID=UPI001A920838|nr:hypothetical protein [Sporosarcina sp. E16_3]MBO0602769.1 hypothetical protein [Sporosarcina sp. E16_3]